MSKLCKSCYFRKMPCRKCKGGSKKPTGDVQSIIEALLAGAAISRYLPGKNDVDPRIVWVISIPICHGTGKVREE